MRHHRPCNKISWQNVHHLILGRHAKHGPWFQCKRLHSKKKKNDKLFKSYNPQKQRNRINLYEGGNTPQTQNIGNLIKQKLHVDNKIIVYFKILTHFPHMQCKEAPSPAMSIYVNLTAQRKIIDQRVIVGPSKTSHQH